MSDEILRLIPTDPSFVPTKKAQAAAKKALRAALPDAEDVTSEVAEHVALQDCGESFDRVLCPACAREIAIETWQGWMDADYAEDGGFRLAPITTPCCNATTTLNDLSYEEPQGFSRYALSVTSPNAELRTETRVGLERALGCRLRTIRQRI